MTPKELNKEIKGVFVPPKKRYYIGKIVHGTPYFYPMNFNGNILSVRKLKLKTQEELEAYYNQYPHLRKRGEHRFKNLPMVRRSKDWIFKLFENHYWVQIGWPIIIYSNELGWKDKFNSPRFEWPPAFYIFFFKWQFCIWWTAPDGDNDKYYEMILQYLHYQDKDIKKAEKNWGWVNMDTKESTWNKDYLL